MADPATWTLIKGGLKWFFTSTSGWAVASRIAVGVVASYGVSKWGAGKVGGHNVGTRNISVAGGAVPAIGGYGEVVSYGAVGYVNVDNDPVQEVYDWHMMHLSCLAHPLGKGRMGTMLGYLVGDDTIDNNTTDLDSEGVKKPGSQWSISYGGHTRAVYLKSNDGSQTDDLPGWHLRLHLLQETFNEWRRHFYSTYDTAMLTSPADPQGKLCFFNTGPPAPSGAVAIATIPTVNANYWVAFGAFRYSPDPNAGAPEQTLDPTDWAVGQTVTVRQAAATGGLSFQRVTMRVLTAPTKYTVGDHDYIMFQASCARTGVFSSTTPNLNMQDTRNEIIGLAKGISCTHWRFRIASQANDQAKHLQIPPQQLASIMLGEAVYDPRRDSTQPASIRVGVGDNRRYDDPTTWGWRFKVGENWVDQYDNPALVWATHLMLAGVDPSDIDWQDVADGADLCDGEVPIPGGTEKRYRCNLVYTHDMKHGDVLDWVLDSFGAVQVYTDRYGLILPQKGASKKSFTSDNVAPNISMVGARDMKQQATKIRARIKGKFVNDDGETTYGDIDIPPRELPSLETIAGPKDTTVTLPAVNNERQGQRLTNLMLQQQRMDEQLSLNLDWTALDLRPGERIDLTLPEIGIDTPKKFRIMDMDSDLSKAFPFKVLLIEDSDDVYDDLAASEYHVVSPQGHITRIADEVAAPTDLAAAPTTNSGEIRVSWVSPGNYDTIQVWASQDSAWSNATKVWEGSASEYLHTGLTGTAAQRTRWYWVRAVYGGIESVRNPDDDVTTIKAVALAA